MHVENIFDGWEEATKTGRFDTRQLVVDIDGFEGPLDLLLTLCRSQKVDLLKVSILQLVDQYLDFIEKAKELSDMYEGECIPVPCDLSTMEGMNEMDDRMDESNH